MKKILVYIINQLIVISLFAQIDYSKYSLPVVCFECDSLDLWGSTGIYSNPFEEGAKWEKPCKVIFYENNVQAFQINCGIRIQGASSVGMPKKSFRLFFRSEYGISKLEYPVFGPGKTSVFDKLVFKSGYDDDLTAENGTLLRDPLITELWNMTSGIPQLSRWVILFLNNQYWGIYNLRESIDQHYIKAHTNFQNFDLVRLKNEGPQLIYGSILGWYDLYNYILTEDLSLNENFSYVESKLDMDEFLNLMAFVQCSQYYSWGWGSSMYRNHLKAAKWKFAVWDADRAFTKPDWDGFYELFYETGSYKWANNFYRHISENDSFMNMLFCSINDLQNTVFNADIAVPVFDSIYTIVKPEICDEINRWNPENIAFENNVEKIREFLRNRKFILNDQLAKKFSVDTTLVKVKLNVLGKGHIKCNTLNIKNYPWEGSYFKNLKLGLTAIPDSGYHFVSWDIAPAHNSNFLNYKLTQDVTVTASFGVGVEVPSINKKIDFSLFPNPIEQKFFINFYVEKNSFIRLYVSDIHGRVCQVLLNDFVLSGEKQMSFNIHNSLPKGAYVMTLKANGLTIENKTIIKK